MSSYNVYKITNTVTGMQYIGCSSKTDSKYMGSGKSLIEDYKKYGRENFNKEILFTYDTPEEALSKEKELIEDIFNMGKPVYNKKQGGAGGIKQSKNKATVFDEEGKALQVNKNHPKILSGDFVSINKGTVVVKDDSGNCFRVSVNDKDFLSGKFKSVLLGKVSVRDTKTGRSFITNSDDERIKNGSLVYASEATQYKKGILNARTVDNKIIKVAKDDPRFNTGELLDVGKPTRYKKGQKWMYHPESGASVAIDASEIGSYKEKGWLFGRGSVKKKWVYNPQTGDSKRLPISCAEDMVRSGWSFGRGSK